MEHLQGQLELASSERASIEVKLAEAQAAESRATALESELEEANQRADRLSAELQVSKQALASRLFNSLCTVGGCVNAATMVTIGGCMNMSARLKVGTMLAGHARVAKPRDRRRFARAMFVRPVVRNSMFGGKGLDCLLNSEYYQNFVTTDIKYKLDFSLLPRVP